MAENPYSAIPGTAQVILHREYNELVRFNQKMFDSFSADGLTESAEISQRNIQYFTEQLSLLHETM